MRRIYKLPVIGAFFRKVDELEMKLDTSQKELQNCKEKIQKQEEQIQEWEEVQQRQEEKLQEQDKRLQEQDKRLQEQDKRLQEQEETIQNQESQVQKQEEVLKNQEIEFAEGKNTLNGYDERLKRSLEKIREIEEKTIPNALDCILSNADWLKKLNVQTSIQPTVWGEEKRLHVSPRAAVFTCFFNVNSGTITVGDYTFAGSNVSILAGSHDMYLTGFLRRDAEFKSGCDITIGKGVWLGSGCTLLGPCSIGDNAIIAAGAVVTPGTVIPSNTVYGGVPAKFIKNILIGENDFKEHVEAALIREQGILFVKGWSEKKQARYRERVIIGHWLIGKEGVIYTNRSEFKLLCHRETEKTELLIEYGATRKSVILEEVDTEIKIMMDKLEIDTEEIRIYSSEYDGEKTFISVE